MNNERYNQIINEAYDNYSKEYEKDNSVGLTMLVQRVDGKSMHRKPNIEMFVTMCTYDSHFSERWGLKIEERELTTVKERKKYDRFFDDLIGEYPEHHKTLDNRGVPRKIITVTYKDEKIEVYE